MLDVVKLARSALQKHGPEERKALSTPWRPDDSRTLHPHPQFARTSYIMLDGAWEFAVIATESKSAAQSGWKNSKPPLTYDRQIRVPFSPETMLSGVNRRIEPSDLLWYRRAFDLSSLSDPTGASRYLLHFEAVDWACSVYVDGTLVGDHSGAYLPFCFDITDALDDGTSVHQLEVCVFDPSDEGSQLRGKQTLRPHGMWYTAQSGIWQSVWLEQVPTSRIAALRATGNPDTKTIELDLFLAHASTSADGKVDVLVEHDGCTVAQTTLRIGPENARACEEEALGGALWPLDSTTTGELLAVRIDVPLEHVRTWTCEDPALYYMKLRFGEDVVSSYCAFRTVSVEKDDQGIPRFCLNHRPLFLEGVLDQGYWPESLGTAPSLEALQYDIAYAQSCGFNMLRKHAKVESDQWYFLCDAAGMLVWQDVPSGGAGWNEQEVCNLPTVFPSRWTLDDGPGNHGRFNADDEAYRHEWTSTMANMIAYLINHPCIVTWVLFNEGWGQFESAQASNLARQLDPTRPIDAASGWFDQGAGDFISEHNYFRSLDLRPKRFKGCNDRAYVISEFGGAVFHVTGHSSCDSVYGYGSATSMDEWQADLERLLEKARSLEPKGLSGYVLTQLSDVEEETNGLMTYDRQVLKCARKQAGA